MVNYVLESQRALYKAKLERVKNKENDLHYRGMTGKTTFVVTYLNDKVLDYFDKLSQVIDFNLINRDSRRWYSKLEKTISNYRVRINYLIKFDYESYTQSLSVFDFICGKHLQMFYNSVSQMLLNKGLSGELKEIASYSIVIHMLSQLSHSTLKDLDDEIVNYLGIKETWMWQLEIPNIVQIASKFADSVVEKASEFNVNEEQDVLTSYRIFCKEVMSSETFKKSMNDEITNDFI